MLVTINTDASFCRFNKIGTYAFWIVSDEFRTKKSDILKGECFSTDEAEAKCIVNAITLLLNKNKNVTKIIVNTDSLNSIALFENNQFHIGRYLRISNEHKKKIVKQYKKTKIILRKPPLIEFRHVKAHSGVNDKRSFVNEWCDTNAKIELRRAIKELKEK